MPATVDQILQHLPQRTSSSSRASNSRSSMPSRDCTASTQFPCSPQSCVQRTAPASSRKHTQHPLRACSAHRGHSARPTQLCEGYQWSTGIGDLGAARRSSLGRLFSRAAILAASTGSTPANGGVCSNRWYRIIANEYTSTCGRRLLQTQSQAGFPLSLGPALDCSMSTAKKE